MRADIVSLNIGSKRLDTSTSTNALDQRYVQIWLNFILLQALSKLAQIRELQ